MFSINPIHGITRHGMTLNAVDPFNSYVERNRDREQTSATNRQRDTGPESDMKGSIYRA